MGRRRRSTLELLFQTLFELPWYVGVSLALVLYFSAPSVSRLSFSAEALDAQPLAPLLLYFLRAVAAISLLAGIASAVRGAFLARKFKMQRSLDNLRALDWREFEAIVGEAFRREGYDVVQTGRAGPDGGVDLVLRRAGKRHLVQCKHFRDWKVGVAIVREIYGVVAAEKADGAIVVTTGEFTPDALEFSRKLPIELIDGRKLEAMVRAIHERKSPRREGPRRIEPSMAATPAEIPMAESAAAPVACPRCSSPMIERRARESGKRFYGCSTFPKCRGIRPID